jgi:hypothetical protein
MDEQLNSKPPLAGGHPLITQASLLALPVWQRELWQPEAEALARTYSLYGDTYYTHKAELGPFVEMPDGTLPSWGMTALRLKKNYGFAVDFWESPFYEACERTLTYFLDRIAASLAAGDLHAAAQFAGTMAHHLEDSGVPAHSVDHGDLEFVKDYLPPPARFASYPLHGYTERSPGTVVLGDYQPRLYGTTAEEAGANFVARYVDLTLQARRLLFPLANCLYRGKEERAAALRNKAATMCAKVLADYLYTATCLGAQRFEERDRRRLRVLKLADRWPYRQTAWAPAPYFEPGPMRLRGINLDMARNPVPCSLNVADAGGVRAERCREALGAGAYFEYHYRVPRGVYGRFTARVGIHATLGAQRSIDFEVKLDGQSAWQKTIRPGEPAEAIDIVAGGCRDIQLISSGPWLTDPDGNNNHVVWDEPRLIRA